MSDDELPADIRELLADSRAQLGPDPAAIARLRMRVAAGVGKGVVGATTAKVVLLGVAIASTGAIAYALRRAPSNATPIAAPVIEVAGSASTDTPLQVRGIEREPSPPVALAPAAPVAAAPTQTAAPQMTTPQIDVIAATTTAPPQPAPTSTPGAHLALAREVQLVDDATRALRRADFARAAAIIRTYDTETSGSGQLAEDAAAIAIEAACGQHADASAPLAIFNQRWPRSAQRARIDAACKGASR